MLNILPSSFLFFKKPLTSSLRLQNRLMKNAAEKQSPRSTRSSFNEPLEQPVNRALLLLSIYSSGLNFTWPSPDSHLSEIISSMNRHFKYCSVCQSTLQKYQLFFESHRACLSGSLNPEFLILKILSIFYTF